MDAALPPVVFVTVNAFAGLEPAAICALGLSLVFVLERIVRRSSVVNALGGALGTGLAVFIALRTGSAEGYFVPRAIQNAVLALIFVGSVAFGKPLVGIVARAMFRYPAAWLTDPLVRRPFAEATLAWAGLFTLRALLYTVLIAAGKAGWLGVTALALGWPAFALLVLFSFRWVPRRLAQLGAPDPHASDAPPPPPAEAAAPEPGRGA